MKVSIAVFLLLNSTSAVKLRWFNDENETKEHRTARLQGYYDKGTALATESAHNNDISEHGVMSLVQQQKLKSLDEFQKEFEEAQKPLV